MNEPDYKDGHERLGAGWFSEVGTLWPGQCMSVAVKEKLHDARSDFQHVQVFETENHGRMLCLDGVIQTTDGDEFAYQEMLTHIPMCTHPNPKTVAVIGAGDGGILREVCRHSSVERVDHCELDKMVCDVSKKLLPNLAVGLEDPRVNTQYADGAAWLANHPGEYDVILVDSSDPVGPAATLFEETFYATMKAALKPGGIVCTQGECMWLHADLIVGMQQFCKKLFKHAEYCYTTIPTYPSGQIGFVVCSEGASPTAPVRELEEAVSDKLQYYTPRIHQASFVLPKFMEKRLKAAGQ